MLFRSDPGPRFDPLAIKLPEGFNSVVVAENLGRARHIAVHQNGDLFVKLERLNEGKGIIRLRDKDGDGRADETYKFSDYTGTGIAIKNGYLYASSNDDVFRYKMDASGNILNPDAPEKIVTGLMNQRQHASKSLALDDAGKIGRAHV